MPKKSKTTGSPNAEKVNKKQSSITPPMSKTNWAQQECLICGEIHGPEIPYCPKLGEEQ